MSEDLRNSLDCNVVASAIVENVAQRIKLRSFFDVMKCNLEGLENMALISPGHVGRLVGITNAMDLIDAWPNKATREKYMPRIQVLSDKAAVIEEKMIALCGTRLDLTGYDECEHDDDPHSV